MMAVFANWGRGQADYVLRFGLLQHSLKRKGRYVMAFVHDYLAVFGHDVFHLALSNQTLDDCYIKSPGFECSSHRLSDQCPWLRAQGTAPVSPATGPLVDDDGASEMRLRVTLVVTR